MTTASIALPPKLIPVFAPNNMRYRTSWGGRGSGKTRTFALMTAIKGYMFAEMGLSGAILCGREFMNSLADSSMEEIKQAIRSVPWLESYYDIGENYIRTRNKRVFYLFCGLRQNLESLKSKARILLCWIDEAETVSEMAYRKLLPTVREQVQLPSGDIYMSEIWVTFNPEKRDSPTSVRFRHEKILDSDGVQIGVGSEMNYMDNPWFPEVLEIERKRDKKNLEDAVYRWIWEGAYLEQSEAQVFKNKYIIEKFKANPKTWDGPYIGLDFGFAQDPTACVKVWIHEDRIYIEYEAGGVGMELDDTVPILEKKIPDIAKYPVYADNARPESISHLRKKGLRRIVGVEKGKGSVEDGIAFIKSFEKVVIHPRCTNTIQEFRDYSYKKDRLTDEILPVLIDKDNHYIDACIEHGQLVSTIKGDIPVQDIRSGDMVLTRKGYKRVNHAWKTYDNAKIWVVKTFNGLELRATENHLIYTSNGFARVDALKKGDILVTTTSIDDRVLTVYATEETNKVYDLEVEGEHEFFASNILVHNCRYALEKIMKQRRAMKISRKAIGAFSR